MVGQLERALEVTPGDPLVKEGILLARRFAPAGDGERVLLDLHLQVGFGEAGHRKGDPVGVLARLFDIIGRIRCDIVVAHGGLRQAGQAIESDGGAVQGREVESHHGYILLDEQCNVGSKPVWALRLPGPSDGTRHE